MAYDLITELTGRSRNPYDLITEIVGRARIDLTVDAGAGRDIEPYETVEITASSSGQPDIWTWEQVNGTPVVLTGVGASRTYVTPATIDGTDLIFQVTATLAGAAPAVDTVTHHIYPHTIWRGSQPVRIALT